MIELRRLLDLSAPPATVWETLWDVPALAHCIPGCGDVTAIEERKRYRATVRDRVGPFTITIPLDVTVTASDHTPRTRADGVHRVEARNDAAPASTLTVRAAGRDSALGSPVTVALTVTLEPSDGGTALAIDGRAEVGGKLATLGQGVVQRKTRDILDRFATNLTALLQSRTGAAAV